MNLPIQESVLNEILSRMDIADISNATIRQSVALTNALEKEAGEPFVHLEIGVPGLPPSQIGIEAQKAALDRGVASIYPNLAGEPPFKQNASRFIKAFLNQDIPAECVVPTVGSMQGCFNLELLCSQLHPEKDTILFVNPGFPAQMTQATVLGIKKASFDIYDYRDEKLGPKLEEYFSQGNIAAIIYSNPNNPTWVCLTDNELETIGRLATKYDVIVLEDMAYMCMDFREDMSHPYEPPYQPTIARFTDNYVMMMSASKIFSYAGERLGIIAFSPKLFHREYATLRERYGLGRMGDNYILTFLYAASSGASHSTQLGVAAMLGAAADGTYHFVEDVREYGRRATIVKEIFERHGFNIVYDKDIDRPVSDGFFFTVGYHGMGNAELITKLLRCGVAAITLNTTGSEQPGIRACVSALKTDDDMKRLDDHLALFAQLN